MNARSNQELTPIGTAEELRVSSRRPDGMLRPYVTIWVFRAGDDLYVRSAYGTQNPWFERARASRAGRIRAGGIERDLRGLDDSRCPRGDRRGQPRQVRPPRARHRGQCRGQSRGTGHPPPSAIRLSGTCRSGGSPTMEWEGPARTDPQPASRSRVNDVGDLCERSCRWRRAKRSAG
jgi:hypothetical protein